MRGGVVSCVEVKMGRDWDSKNVKGGKEEGKKDTENGTDGALGKLTRMKTWHSIDSLLAKK